MNHMRYVSRESIERAIELQRIKREGMKKPQKKIPLKKIRRKHITKEVSYKPRKVKITKEIKKEEKKKTESFDVKALLKVIREYGPITREELVKITKHPRSTLFDNLYKLMRENILKKTSLPCGKRGRPSVVWSIKQSQRGKKEDSEKNKWRKVK